MVSLGCVLSSIYHDCGEIIEHKTIPVSKEIFGANSFYSDYCSKCGVYVFNCFKNGKKSISFKKPEHLAEFLENLDCSFQ